MDLHKKFVFYGKNAKEWMRKCELLLPEIDRKRIWKKHKYGSIYEYAASLAGMSREKVTDCIRIHRRIGDKPVLLAVAEKKGIGVLRPVATIVTQETAEFWADKASTMSRRALEKFTQNYREESRHVTESQSVKLTINPKLAKRLENFKNREDFEELLEKFLDSIEDDKPEVVQTESRHIPKQIQDYVLAKTGGKCAYPGCDRRYEVLHHAKRFSECHEHNPDHLVPLCKGHHDLAHLGYIENELSSPENWRIRRESEPDDIDKLVMRHRSC